MNKKLPRDYPLDTFYYYGWCGRLSNSARERAAHDLLEIIKHYKGAVTLISHSHGGNVALNIAKLAEAQALSLTIERLIMLACPVQDITESFVNSKIFKKVFSLFSPADIFQVADPQGFHVGHGMNWPSTSIFSRREFKNAPHIIQIKLKRDGRSLNHLNYIQAPFFNDLADLLNFFAKDDNRDYCKDILRTKYGSYCIDLANWTKKELGILKKFEKNTGT